MEEKGRKEYRNFQEVRVVYPSPETCSNSSAFRVLFLWGTLRPEPTPSLEDF